MCLTHGDFNSTRIFSQFSATFCVFFGFGMLIKSNVNHYILSVVKFGWLANIILYSMHFACDARVFSLSRCHLKFFLPCIIAVVLVVSQN